MHQDRTRPLPSGDAWPLSLRARHGGEPLSPGAKRRTARGNRGVKVSCCFCLCVQFFFFILLLFVVCLCCLCFYCLFVMFACLCLFCFLLRMFCCLFDSCYVDVVLGMFFVYVLFSEFDSFY
jgi:hypothetical protein